MYPCLCVCVCVCVCAYVLVWVRKTLPLPLLSPTIVSPTPSSLQMSGAARESMASSQARAATADTHHAHHACLLWRWAVSVCVCVCVCLCLSARLSVCRSVCVPVCLVVHTLCCLFTVLFFSHARTAIASPTYSQSTLLLPCSVMGSRFALQDERKLKNTCCDSTILVRHTRHMYTRHKTQDTIQSKVHIARTHKQGRGHKTRHSTHHEHVPPCPPLSLSCTAVPAWLRAGRCVVFAPAVLPHTGESPRLLWRCRLLMVTTKR